MRLLIFAVGYAGFTLFHADMNDFPPRIASLSPVVDSVNYLVSVPFFRPYLASPTHCSLSSRARVIFSFVHLF